MNRRWLVIAAVAAFGLWRGGISGMFISLFIFGFFCFLFYTLQDGLHAVTGFMHQPVVYVEKDGQPTIKGHPDVEGTAKRTNPDPTRPDTDDFMGLITYKVEKKYRG
jgi:hypothetical protein